MFDTIQALIEQKQANHPLLSRIWKDLVEYLGSFDVKPSISAYYHTEFGSYANLAILTTRLIIDLEANEETQLQQLFISELKTVGSIVTTNLPDAMTEPISSVATGATKNPTLAGMLLTIEGTKFISWYAIREEEDELRMFIRNISTTRFS